MQHTQRTYAQRVSYQDSVCTYEQKKNQQLLDESGNGHTGIYLLAGNQDDL